MAMFCKNQGLRQSMSKAGCPYDNAPMERYYNTFKNSFYYINRFESIKAMDDATDRYVNYYNYVRPHSYNDYLTLDRNPWKCREFPTTFL
jgi:Transposase and inactivated derivatives